MGLRIVFDLPAPGAADVAEREFTIQIGSEPIVTVSIAKDGLLSPEYEVADNAVVAVTLCDIDDAGNRSPVQAQTFTVADTIPPPQPGEIGMRVLGET